MNVYEHLSRWFGVNEDENEAAAEANGEGELREPGVQVELPAPENDEGEDGEPNDKAE